MGMPDVFSKFHDCSHWVNSFATTGSSFHIPLTSYLAVLFEYRWTCERSTVRNQFLTSVGIMYFVWSAGLYSHIVFVFRAQLPHCILYRLHIYGRNGYCDGYYLAPCRYRYHIFHFLVSIFGIQLSALSSI